MYENVSKLRTKTSEIMKTWINCEKQTHSFNRSTTDKEHEQGPRSQLAQLLVRMWWAGRGQNEQINDGMTLTKSVIMGHNSTIKYAHEGKESFCIL